MVKIPRSTFMSQGPNVQWQNHLSPWSLMVQHGHTVRWQLDSTDSFTGMVEIDGVLYDKVDAQEDVLKPFLNEIEMYIEYIYLFEDPDAYSNVGYDY